MKDTPDTPAIVGIDPSLAGCGMVALPPSWDGSWTSVQRSTVGYELSNASSCRQHIRRLEHISEKAVQFARNAGAQVIGLESFPFGKISAAWSLGKIFGVLSLDLHREGFEVRTIPISSARKLLLGALPRVAVKQCVADHWGRLKAPWATLDECDAACTANYLSAQLGGAYFEGGRLWLPRETEVAS